MINLKKILNRSTRGKIMYSLKWLPDKPYLQLFYWATTGRRINFKHPKGFNEKLQWLKINDRHLEYSKLVDKFAVREHITEVLGEEYLFPLLGHWRSFEDIDFKALPNQFVLKCNHDSGSTRVIKNKTSLTQADFNEMRSFYTKKLKRDFFNAGREYPYKGIEPCIIVEQFMVNESNPESSIEDYKFYCFGGEPKAVLIVTDRNVDCRFDFFDMEFNHLDIQKQHPNADKPIKKPKCFDEMKVIARKLAAEKKMVRIDLYELNGTIYFGEYTFFPGGGFDLLKPEKWEKQFGEWIDLNK